MPKWTAKTDETVTTVKFDTLTAGEPVWILLRSDAHHDSPYCDRKLEREHLERALEREALIFDAGDTFDAMQGKFDPRRNMEDVRPENAVAHYYDSIVEHAADDYKPYAQQWVMFGKGNHESKVLEKQNTDLISNLVYHMNSETGSDIVTGYYGGYIRLLFTWNKTKRKKYVIYYHHGAGGVAPVTRGVIQSNRQSVFVADANMVWNGHNHQNYTVPIPRDRLSNKGKRFRDILWHVRTPGYKDEWSKGDGYAVEKGQGPTPLGCCWLRFFVRNDKLKVEVTSEIE